MEDSDKFTPNFNGCKSVLCKYNVTSDGDDAVSYKKALQTLQSTLRKDKYNGNGVAAQNDPLYKNLARCVGFFDNNKDRFPRQRDCKSTKSKPSRPQPSQSRRASPPQSNNSRGFRKPAPLSEIRTTMNNVGKLSNYLGNTSIHEVYNYIQAIDDDVDKLNKYKLSSHNTLVLNEIKRLLRITETRYSMISNTNVRYSENVAKVVNEMKEYLEATKGSDGTDSYTNKNPTKKAAAEEAKRAREEAKKAEKAAKKAADEAKKAENEGKKAEDKAKKEEVKRRKAEETARKIQEKLRKAHEEKFRKEQEKKRAKEEAMRAASEARKAEEEAKRAASEEANSRKSNLHNKTKRKTPPRASPRHSPERNSSKKKRCPNGTRRNKNTGNCEPYNK